MGREGEEREGGGEEWGKEKGEGAEERGGEGGQ